MLLVTLCWASCGGLAFHPRGSGNNPSHFMLGILWWTSISSRGGVVIRLVTLCWVSCDGLASHPGRSSNTPSHFILGIL